MALTSKLTAIADAIRAKTGKSGALTLAQMPAEIQSIQTGSSDIPFEYGGLNAVKVAEYDETYSLADTSFEVGVTNPTAATTILASVSNKYTNTTGSPTYAYGDKDIVVVQTLTAKPTHGSGATGKAQQVGYAAKHVAFFSKRKTSDTSARNTRQVYNLSTYINSYYNTSGTLTRGVANYGFYITATAPTVYSATSASTYVRVGSPALACRASTSYETQANMLKVTDCRWTWHVDIYVVDIGSTPVGACNDDMDDILLNL